MVVVQNDTIYFIKESADGLYGIGRSLDKSDESVFFAWFVLQHYKGFKPFITKLEIIGKLKGSF